MVVVALLVWLLAVELVPVPFPPLATGGVAVIAAALGCSFVTYGALCRGRVWFLVAAALLGALQLGLFASILSPRAVALAGVVSVAAMVCVVWLRTTMRAPWLQFGGCLLAAVAPAAAAVLTAGVTATARWGMLAGEVVALFAALPLGVLYCLELIEIGMASGRFVVPRIWWGLRKRAVWLTFPLGILPIALYAALLFSAPRNNPPLEALAFVFWGAFLGWVVLIITRRMLWSLIVRPGWTGFDAALLQSVSVGAVVVGLLVGLATTGRDWLEVVLGAPRMLPPVFLFALVTAVNMFSLGARFCNGRVAPRARELRVLGYFGLLMLVVSGVGSLASRASPFPPLPEFLPLYIGMSTFVGMTLWGVPYWQWKAVSAPHELVGELPDEAWLEHGGPANPPEPVTDTTRVGLVVQALSGGRRRRIVQAGLALCGGLVFAVLSALTPGRLDKALGFAAVMAALVAICQAGVVWLLVRRPPGPDQAVGRVQTLTAFAASAALLSASWAVFVLIDLVPPWLGEARGTWPGWEDAVGSIALCLLQVVVAAPIVRSSWPVLSMRSRPETSTGRKTLILAGLAVLTTLVLAFGVAAGWQSDPVLWSSGLLMVVPIGIPLSTALMLGAIGLMKGRSWGAVAMGIAAVFAGLSLLGLVLTLLIARHYWWRPKTRPWAGDTDEGPLARAAALRLHGELRRPVQLSVAGAILLPVVVIGESLLLLPLRQWATGAPPDALAAVGVLIGVAVTAGLARYVVTGGRARADPLVHALVVAASATALVALAWLAFSVFALAYPRVARFGLLDQHPVIGLVSAIAVAAPQVTTLLVIGRAARRVVTARRSYPAGVRGMARNGVLLGVAGLLFFGLLLVFGSRPKDLTSAERAAMAAMATGIALLIMAPMTVGYVGMRLGREWGRLAATVACIFAVLSVAGIPFGWLLWLLWQRRATSQSRTSPARST